MNRWNGKVVFVLGVLWLSLGWFACDGAVGKDEVKGESPVGEVTRDVAGDANLVDVPADERGGQETPSERPLDTRPPEKGAEPGARDAGGADGGNVDTSPPEQRAPDVSGPDMPQGAPIKAPAEKWTWVDVPGSKCGYGKETGFAVNLKPGAKRVLIYFQGGGACWKEKGGIGSCFEGVPTSFNLTGFDKKTFERDLVTRQNLGSAIFRRKDFDNVFHDAHMVFFPYCTGDVFSGQRVVKFSSKRTMHFVGHSNIKLFMARLVPTFRGKGVKQAVIAGSSAGGFGAALNWWYIQQAFGQGIRVDLIDDSGPPIEPKEGRWAEWYKIWDTALPPGCAGCDKKIAALMEYYKATLLKQGRRMGFLTYDRDAIIRNFFGISNFLGAEFKKRIDALFDEMDKVPNAHYFALSGSSHTLLLLSPKLLRSKDRVPLMRWLEWMVEDNPAWKSHRP